MNRRTALKAGLVMIGGIWVPKQQGATIIVRGPRVATAAGAWHESFDIGTSDGGKIWNWVDARLTKVVPSTTGNCTKLRFRLGANYTSGAYLKLALYNSSRVPLVGATSAAIDSASNQWIEVTVSSTAVTSSTTYFIGSLANTDQIEPISLSGQPSGDGYYDSATNYAGFHAAPDPFTNTPITYRFGASMWVE
jgi:hypothetical protein